MQFIEQRHYEIDSTQKQAIKEAKKNSDAHGIVVIAEKQTKGLGRTGRKWESPLGGLYISVVIKKGLPVKYFHGFAVRFGLRIAQKMIVRTNLPFKVKWPNDLMINGKKVGGILIDMATNNEILDYMVIGMGINVNINIKQLPPDVQLIATSILEECNKRFSLKIVKDEILSSIKEIIEEFEQGVFKDLSSEWAQYSHTFGKKIKTEALGDLIEGIESGITSKGDLKLVVDGKEKIISAGDVFLTKKS